MSDTEWKNLLSAEEMWQCFADRDRDKSDVVSVVVGGGVYREKTIAAHFKVGRTSDGDVQAEMRSIVIDSFSANIDRLAWHLAEWLKEAMPTCTVIVDKAGLGGQFIELLRQHFPEARVVESLWGKPCDLERNRLRFVNKRSQCNVDAANAAKHGRLRLPMGRREELVDQATKIPIQRDDHARFVVRKRSEGVPSPDMWDIVCLAFLEDVHV